MTLLHILGFGYNADWKLTSPEPNTTYGTAASGWMPCAVDEFLTRAMRPVNAVADDHHTLARLAGRPAALGRPSAYDRAVQACERIPDSGH